jgi:hypothetical protein
MRCLQLPFRFDPARLRADLAAVHESEWIPHINRRHYDGEWSGAALRSVAGAAKNLVPEARGDESFADTALLGRCAYFREVLSAFRCPLLAVRLLKLHPQSRVAEHVDHALDFEDGEVRLHVPVVTSEAVHFYLDGARLIMWPGECWYTNVNLPHSVENRGPEPRVHLVLDCRVDPWLRELFAATPRPPADHYAATVRFPGHCPAPALLALFATIAGDRAAATGARVTFRSEGATLVLQWSGAHAWQLRLRLPTSGTVAEIESSPAGDGAHRADFAALVDALRTRFPDAQLAVRLPA